MALQVFGLTGGLGSGKSTVLARFIARGVPAADADELARKVVEPGTPALAEIVRAFGPLILKSDGNLDRRALAARVFSDPDARARLQAITHPRIRALADETFRAIEVRGEPLACYDAPLLFEVGLDAQYSPTVVVTAPESLQIERAALRDGTDVEDLRGRILAQLPLSEKADRADYVIDNSGELEDTYRQADRVLDSICERVGVDPSRYPIPD